VANRALVISKGSVTAELDGKELTKENLMKHA
jgi:ABC-type sugar transport system ATPase subunit